jgi:hypothetical protein
VAALVVQLLVSNLRQGPMAAVMNADAEYNLGEQLTARGSWGRRRSTNKNAIRERPDFLEAWVNLGVRSRRRGATTRGRALSRKRSGSIRGSRPRS